MPSNRKTSGRRFSTASCRMVFVTGTGGRWSAIASWSGLAAARRKTTTTTRSRMAPDPGGRSPDELVQTGEAMQELESAVSRLPARQREAFHVAHLRGPRRRGNRRRNGLQSGQRPNTLFPGRACAPGRVRRTLANEEAESRRGTRPGGERSCSTTVFERLEAGEAVRDLNRSRHEALGGDRANEAGRSMGPDGFPGTGVPVAASSRRPSVLPGVANRATLPATGPFRLRILERDNSLRCPRPPVYGGSIHAS